MQSTEKTHASSFSTEAIPERTTVNLKESNRRRFFEILHNQYGGNMTLALNDIIENIADYHDMVKDEHNEMLKRTTDKVRYILFKNHSHEKRTEANLSA